MWDEMKMEVGGCGNKRGIDERKENNELQMEIYEAEELK
jgi:hypothetical protein